MKRISKFLCLLLVLAMIMPMIPAVVRAEEVPGEAETDRIEVPVPEEETDEVLPETEILTAHIPFQVNPLYEGLITADDLDIPELPERDPEEIATHASYYYTIEEAAKQIRKYMKKRTETFTINVKAATGDYNGLANEMLAIALEHTGQPTEGDYIRWQYGGISANITYSYNETTDLVEYTYDFVVPYYTTAAQEEELNTTVSRLLSNLGIRYKSDYEKVTAIYDWICENVTYDYDNLEDDSYTLKFSAYAAMANKTAVCQGYALLFYRLMLELGVDARFIGGDGGGPHAWNIVQLGDYYYNLDSTWDAGQEEYSWFLTSFWDFPGHQRDLEFDTFEFHEAYPVAAESYEPGKTATRGMDITGGYCGTEDNGYANAMWFLNLDGSLTITGIGSTLDYNSSNRQPYFMHWQSGITRVVVDEGITRIGDYAFYQLPNLTEVVTSGSLEEIGQYAFKDCTSITMLNLPDSLTTIGKHAFHGLTGITSLKLPSGLTEIGENAFYQCTALKEVVFPDNITVIGRGMFAYCTALEKVHLPANLVTIETSAFFNCQALNNVELPDSLKTINGSAFNFCTSLASIELPAQLESIGTGAFLGCRKLKSITFPANVTLGMNVLDLCTSLETVILPEGLTEIPQEMFARCSALKTVVIPESVTVIQGYAFNECTALESIDLPDHLTTIGRYAFTKCTSLKSIAIPETVTVLEEGAFNNCTSLKSANLPKNLQTIKDYTFYLCPLERVDIPAGVKSIGQNAFRGAMITELVIPEGVERINQNAFGYCTELTQVDLPDSLKYLCGFGGCTQLTSVSIPDNVQTIGGYAFAGCTALENVTMSMNVTDIDMEAFANCTALENIMISATIEWIQYRAFRGCSQLKEIKFLGNAPNFQYDTFSGVTATAYYPANDSTWTEDKLRNYGGTITWVPYGEASEPTAKFTTISTSLGGNIAMNFYLELSEDLVSDPDAYIQFTYAGKTLNVPLSEGVLSGGVYRFSCPITSKNMTDNITAQVYNSNGPVGASKTMDVATYCNWVIANYTDAKTVNLMKAMLNYGASAQQLFKYRTDDLANAALSDADKVLGKVDASAYIHSRTGEEEGIKPTTYTLLLDSETTVRVYFQLTGNKTIDEYTFTVDGVEVEPVFKDGLYYIQKTDIGAHRLDELHVFTCGNITIRYGGLSYVNQVMTYYTEGTTFDMASALFAYSKAAEAYIG